MEMTASGTHGRIGGIIMKLYFTTFITAIISAIFITAVTPGFLHAEEPIAYPARDQSKEQSEQDRFICYQWAREATGFDPVQPPIASAPPPEATNSTIAGAVGGAIVGTAIGIIAGHPGRGAAIGALSGGVIGGAHQYNSEQEREQYIRQQSANISEKRNEYNRAWSACMEGRGYTVR